MGKIRLFFFFTPLVKMTANKYVYYNAEKRATEQHNPTSTMFHLADGLLPAFQINASPVQFYSLDGRVGRLTMVYIMVCLVLDELKSNHRGIQINTNKKQDLFSFHLITVHSFVLGKLK